MLATGVSVCKFLVLGFSEAFWNVPLHPEERRFFCAKLTMNGLVKFLAYLRTAQGSRGAPTTWARLAALIMRLTQGVVMEHAMMMCYVDGPFCVLGGTTHECDRTAATIALIWSALGLPLQLSK